MLPTAPLALVLCWWSLEMETNSKCALLCGEGGWGQKRPCVHWPHHPTFCQLGRNPARAHFRKGTKVASGSCVLKMKLSSGNQLSPNVCLLRKAALSDFSPRSLLALGPRKFCAAYCSLGTGAVLVVSAAENQLQMCTPLRRRRMGPEYALCARAPPAQLSPAREGPS